MKKIRHRHKSGCIAFAFFNVVFNVGFVFLFHVHISTEVEIDIFFRSVFSYSSVGFVAQPPSSQPVSRDLDRLPPSFLAFAFIFKFISPKILFARFAHSGSEECSLIPAIFSESDFSKNLTSETRICSTRGFMTFPFFEYLISNIKLRFLKSTRIQWKNSVICFKRHKKLCRDSSKLEAILQLIRICITLRLHVPF